MTIERQSRKLLTATFPVLLGVLVGCQQNTLSPQTQPAQAVNARPDQSPVVRKSALGMASANDPQPTPEQVARMIESNVLGVSCFYDPFNPWIWNTEHSLVKGIKINALYLRGPNYTGVFGDGVIRPKLYLHTRDEQGNVQYKLIKEWTFDVQQAMPFRAKRRMKAGWGYALFLNWGDMDLTGRSLHLTVSFERADGIVISGSKKDFRVPKPNNM